ncbi:MAG: hypothetical protein Q4D94_13415 [Bacillota bacterium]|nr:hypothetical protein [Bacillota bacterium]
MGLILKPSEVKNCAKQVRAGIEGSRKSYAGALQVVQNFAGNEALKSKSWDTAKGKIVESHQLIVQGIVAAQESMVSELSTAEEVLDGEERNEEQLIQDIIRLEEECERYIEMIKKLSKLASRSMIASWSISRLISHYQEMLETTKKELELVKEELNKLYDQAEQTSALFKTIGTLLHAVECAINDAEVYISGRGELSDGSWGTLIPTMVEEINAVINKEKTVNVQYGESTRQFLKEHEGMWETVVETKGVYSIGYGCDFTKESAPELYQKYVINGEKITEEDADILLDEKVVLFVQELDKFVDTNQLDINQNQYDALVSYFYNNGPYVFTDAVYNSWIEKEGEYAVRAEARKCLKEYLINENGNYNEQTIINLFVASKGPNIKYEYITRRTDEANLFNKKEND